MDSQTRTGKVFLQSHKPGKKWKPVWMSLVPPSSSGVGRLEIQDFGGGGAGAGGDLGTRRLHQPHGEKKLKVVRLTELLSVLRLPPQAEACPMENMSAFCVETQDRTMVFAALKDDSALWVEKLCQWTFQGGGGAGGQQLHMEDNQIYVSADEVRRFWTVVQRTEAASRCGLQGAYWLEVGREALQLREPQKKDVVREWPFELLRRYGRDKLTFTIEAGRRCHSGPGTFTFETPQAEKIFSLIQSSIKRKTLRNQNQNQDQDQDQDQDPDGEGVSAANVQARSPLPQAPDLGVMAPPLEAGPPAPITLMPLPSVPTHGSPSSRRHGDRADAIYANPLDCLQGALTPEPTSALYVDPASVLPLQPPPACSAVAPPPGLQGEPMDSEYSEVYDRVDRREPVYAEPLSAEDEPPQRSAAAAAAATAADPFAHLYAQVCKRGRGQNTRGPAQDDDDDVIYENLGII